MAGVKGRSGGARPGAGRKKKEQPAAVKVDEGDPLQFLLGVMQGTIDPTPLQIRAAIAAAQYVHTRTRDGGKKDAQADRAKQAASGRFAPKAPPKLVVSNG